MDQAELEWTEAGEPRSVQFDDYYFNTVDGSAESKYVFIEGSQLRERLEKNADTAFTIAELGFGTGLNFLLSVETFLQHAAPDTRLHYWSIDRHPLNREALKKSLQRWPQLSDLARELTEVYPPPLPGVHRRTVCSGRVTLDLVWADVDEGIQELSGLDLPIIDAWYLDGFSPQQNPCMWSPALYPRLIAASRAGATIATYTASSAVRRSLSAAGFVITKRPGFGLKRECLQGVVPDDAEPAAIPPTITPWDLTANPCAVDANSALVIGAGLAGSHAAAALARRGMVVTVLDEGAVAGRGSSNAQGVLFTRVSHQRSILGDFSQHAFLFARQLYREMFDEGSLRLNLDGALSGCVQIDAPRGDGSILARALLGLEELAESCSAETIAQRLGLPLETSGLWQPGSGWLAPPAVCRALLAKPGITVEGHCGALTVSQSFAGHWEAKDSRGNVRGKAPILILAAGPDGRTLPQMQGLPLRVVRGQTTQIPAPAGKPLLSSFCHRGYIAPAVNGEHCIGATFKPGDDSREIRIDEHRDNLLALAKALPHWAEQLSELDPKTLQGRAELRCVSPDYLPLAGPLPDETAFAKQFSALQWDASTLIPEKGVYQRGLYLSTAHGSRGLSYAALGAELIASQIFEEPIPVSRELQRALCPARFLLRGLVRGTSRFKAASA